MPIVSYLEFKQNLPNRNSFINKVKFNAVDQIIRQCKPLPFMPTHLSEPNVYEKGENTTYYKIALIGVFPDGRRANVLIDDIEPYFEVRIPNAISIHDEALRGQDYKESQYISKLTSLVKSSDQTKPVRMTKIQAKPFKYYREELSTYIRFYYHNLKERSAALKLVQKHGYETATDDASCYYRVVSRDNLATFCSWATISDYRQTTFNRLKGYTYRVSINDYKTFNYDKYVEETQITAFTLEDFMKERSLSVCWDIETWSRSGDLPTSSKPEDKMFCLSLTYQWINEKEPILKQIICELPAAGETAASIEAKHEYTTIVCGSETNLIKCFADSIESMKPEFIFGFNDSDYDWPWLIGRASQTKGLLSYMADRLDSTIPYDAKQHMDQNILNYSYKLETVKIEATANIDGRSLMLPGYIPVDVRTIFRKLYPVAEQTSLKWFLQQNKLGSKEDMPIPVLFRIYGELFDLSKHPNVIWKTDGTAKEFKFKGEDDIVAPLKEKYNSLLNEMADVNYYCIIDAQRCHDLLRIRNIIMDNREVSAIAYTSLFDAFYRANGMKVKNLTMAIGQKAPFNIRFSNIISNDIEDAKYPGAFVFPPKKGLKISKLSLTERVKKAQLTYQTNQQVYTEWLDTSEEELNQYYNIIEKYGACCSSAKIDEIEKEISQETKQEYEMPQKLKSFLLEENGIPIIGLDFSSLYPSIIRAYNFSPEYCIIDQILARKLHNEGQKLTKVDFIFGGRKCKGWFVWHNNLIDPKNEKGFQFGIYPYVLDDLFNKRKALKVPLGEAKRVREELEAKGLADTEEYDDVIFKFNYYNSKQNALKVFMNTFYGVAGNQNSSFFMLQVAGGVTQYGKENIQLGFRKVKELGCRVYYGDTDSIYLSVPDKSFVSLDKLYFTNKMDKLNYWTQLVDISFKEIKYINKVVNDCFKEDNGTNYLTMAYEEVLYPVAFTAKKKYFGIPHEHIANFKPKELFVKGLEVKKRGTSDLLKKIFNDIMWTCVSVDNLYNLYELVIKKIDEIYKYDWQFNDFIQTAVYRRNKLNQKVITFVNRMKERGIEVKPNDRFSYVIVKKYPYRYDMQGRKEELSVGDYMEFVDEAKKYNMEINLDHYMQSSILGQLGRLITYHPMFHVDPLDDSNDELKRAEDTIYKNACKHVAQYADKYMAQYNQLGKTYKKIFVKANNIFKSFIRDETLTDILADDNMLDNDKLLNKYELQAQKQCVNYGKEQVGAIIDNIPYRDRKVKISELLNKFIAARGNEKSLKYQKEMIYKAKRSELMKRLQDNTVHFSRIHNVYKGGLEKLINTVKSNIGLSEDLFKPQYNQAMDYKNSDLDLDVETDQLETMAKEYTTNMYSDEKNIEIMNKISEIKKEILNNEIDWAQTQSIIQYLNMLKDSMNGETTRPPETLIQQTKEKGIDRFKNIEYTF